MSAWWSWVLGPFGLFGLWLTTRKDWRGYLVGVAVQGLWLAYAVVTVQLGFIATALAYGVINVLGIRSWRAKTERPGRHRKPACPVCFDTGEDVSGLKCGECLRGDGAWSCTQGFLSAESPITPRGQADSDPTVTLGEK